MCCVVVALGVFYLMIFHLGKQSITIFVAGVFKMRGKLYRQSYVSKFDSNSTEKQALVVELSIVSLSKQLSKEEYVDTMGAKRSKDESDTCWLIPKGSF
jgi:hypothetical protein